MPTYNFNLTAQINLQTVVSSQGGGTNNVATINVIFAGTTLWSGVMIQSAPQVVTPLIQTGDGHIDAGSTFNLTVPTALMNGNVVANVSYVSPPNPQETFHGQIATWTQSST